MDRPLGLPLRAGVSSFLLSPSRALERASRGEIAGQILEGLNAFDLVVRGGDARNLSAATIAETLVDTPSGAKLPLKALARLQEDRSPNFISRENVQRKIVVMCNVSGRDMRGVVEDIQRAVEQKVELPAGATVSSHGSLPGQSSGWARVWEFVGVGNSVISLAWVAWVKTEAEAERARAARVMRIVVMECS